jgi:hypothetical protein
MEEVGGFYVSLKTLVDEGSFRKGIDGIKGIAGGLAGLIAKAAAIVGVGVGLKAIVDVAHRQQDLLNFAHALGMGATELETWQDVLGRAQVDAQGFLGTIKSLNDEMTRQKTGGQAMSLDKLAAIDRLLGAGGVDKLYAMNTSQRMSALLDAAKNIGTAQSKVDLETLMGAGGGRFLEQMKTDRMSMAQELANMSRYGFTNDQNVATGARVSTELNTLGTAAGSIFNLVADETLKALEPDIKGLLAWLTANRGTIQSLATSMGNLVKGLAEFLASPFAISFAAQKDPDYESGGKYDAKGRPLRKALFGMEKSLIEKWVDSGSGLAWQLYGSEVQRWRTDRANNAGIRLVTGHIVIENRAPNQVKVRSDPNPARSTQMAP